MTEDEIVGWHYQQNGHEFKQTPGDSKGQGSLACCIQHDLVTVQKQQQGLPKNILNTSDERGHSFLDHDLQGNAFNFSPLRTMVSVDFSYMALIMLM